MFSTCPSRTARSRPRLWTRRSPRSRARTAVVLGPGLGRSDRAGELARELTARIEVPLVIDADGLNALAGRRLDELSARGQPTVLTPHAERARAPARGRRRRDRPRAAAARAAAARSGAPRRAQGRRHARGGPVRTRRGLARRRARPRRPAPTTTCSPASPARCSRKGLAPEHAACAAVRAHLRAGQLAAALRRAGSANRIGRHCRASRRTGRIGLRPSMPPTVADIMDTDTPVVSPEDARTRASCPA